MNDEAVSKWAEADLHQPIALRTQVFIVHMMDVVAVFLTHLHPRKESTTVMRRLEKSLCFERHSVEVI
jgi:hypothetical protein